MRILFLGDVVGRSGRDCIQHYLPQIKTELKPDCIVVNGENAAHGFGITAEMCAQFYGWGIHVITTGNHAFDHRDIMTYMQNDPMLIRPANYPKDTPGRGHTIYTTYKGQKILVINVMGRIFMDPLDDPFKAVDDLLKSYTLGHNIHGIVVDMHAEASSEKMGMGHYCDGRASLVVGTHTHIPTADTQILPNGTGYMTDAGMCGDYNSVVGMEKDIPLFKMTRRIPPIHRMKPAAGTGTLCGVFVELNEKGLCKNIAPIRMGARLAPHMPSF